MSRPILILFLSFLGIFHYWYFTGVLTSILTVKSYNLKVKSLEDLKTVSHFELSVSEQGSTHSMLIEWAMNDSYPWRKNAYDHFVKPYIIPAKGTTKYLNMLFKSMLTKANKGHMHDKFRAEYRLNKSIFILLL